MTVTEKTGYFVGGAWHTGIHPSLIGKRIVRTGPCECPYGMDYSYSVLGKYGPRDPKHECAELIEICDDGSMIIKWEPFVGCFKDPLSHLPEYWNDGNWIEYTGEP